MANKRILLVGEAANDIWVEGECLRLSPEAPVPIQRPTKVTSNPGMAANVCENLKSLAPGLQIDFFHQSKAINKIRHIDQASGAHLLRVDDGDDSFEPDFAAKVIEGMAMNPDGYSAFIISDYCKGLLSETFIANLVEIAHEIGALVYLDTKKVLGPWSQNVDFVKINEKEYRANLDAGVQNPREWCRHLIVTQGKKGSKCWAPEGLYDVTIDPAKYLEKPDVAGCGDTYLAAFVLKYTECGEIMTSMEYAGRASRVAASKAGVVAVSKDEVDHA